MIATTTTTPPIHERPQPASNGWRCGVADGGSDPDPDPEDGSEVANTTTDADESGGVGDEEIIETVIETNDLLLEVQYGKHLIVLMAVAALEECDSVEAVRTGAINDVADQIVTETQYRYVVENSLETLAERGFLTATSAETGNARDWSVSEKGWRMLTLPREQGIISALADSDITAEV